MDKTIKEKWVEALRSGRYEQGVGKLRSNDNKYCCLGVLCDLTGCTWQEEPDGYAATYQYARGSVYPPKALREFLEMSPKDEETLASYNDMGRTFCEIADKIEKYF